MRGRDVAVIVPDDLPLVAIDEVLIERVLVNLLENALRYTPPGSPLELVASATGDEIAIEVRDRGPGLVPGEESLVFDQFFRGEASRGRRGAGLGLAVARAIVEAHGGRIEATNRPGGGAVFRLTLPTGGAPPAVGGTADESGAAR
jgi:two-component system sensor histidine kinase KdpD